MKRREFIAASLASLAGFTLKAEESAKPTADAEENPASLFEVAPHVQLMGEDSAALVWVTMRPATGSAEWSQDDGKTWTKVWAETDGLRDAGGRVHKAVLFGYDPKRPLKYRAISREVLTLEAYKATFGDEETREGALDAMLPPNGSIAFQMFNDVHEQTQLYPKLLKYNTAPVSFNVFCGDIMSHVDTHEQVCEMLLAPLAEVSAKTRAPMWYLRGNHETRGPLARHLRDYLALPGGNFFGAVTIGGVRFIFIDTGDDKFDEHPEYSGIVDFESYIARQTAWIEREMASDAWKNAKARIAFMHIPPPVTCVNGYDSTWRLPRHEKLNAVLAKSGVTAVFAAHLHIVAADDGRPDRPYPLFVGGGPADEGDARVQNRGTVIRGCIAKDALDVTCINVEGKTLFTRHIPLK